MTYTTIEIARTFAELDLMDMGIDEPIVGEHYKIIEYNSGADYEILYKPGLEGIVVHDLYNPQPGQLEAEDCGRQEVTPEFYMNFMNGKYPAYMFNSENAEFDLEPWIVVEGIDKHITDEHKVDVWIEGGCCKTRNPLFLRIFVQLRDLPVEILHRLSEYSRKEIDDSIYETYHRMPEVVKPRYPIEIETSLRNWQINSGNFPKEYIDWHRSAALYDLENRTNWNIIEINDVDNSSVPYGMKVVEAIIEDGNKKYTIRWYDRGSTGKWYKKENDQWSVFKEPVWGKIYI